ncbi:MAG: hypothetical protein KTR13_07750 [Saprospiraceae bacterium]|nr:hypothetical protein [Saprospiraceae bacterium]
MKKMLLALLILLAFTACSSEKQTSTDEESAPSPAPTILQQPNTVNTIELPTAWEGITLIEQPDLNICSVIASEQSDTYSKCVEFEATDIALLNAQFDFSKANKAYKMNAVVFRNDPQIQQEIPIGNAMNIAGNAFQEIDFMENTRAFLSKDMLRIYPNSQQKILISNYLVEQDQRELPADNSEEMKAIGQLLITQFQED